jgi:hypothetical protein
MRSTRKSSGAAEVTPEWRQGEIISFRLARLHAYRSAKMRTTNRSWPVDAVCQRYFCILTVPKTAPMLLEFPPSAASLARRSLAPCSMFVRVGPRK